ncbi:MAG TPA: biosynthetic arginine decarboxylase [Pseudomonadales bacterium]|nr:biosynthetic arginine decarboxylase [Pseudomonadales bacterium]HNC69105.1 biosynthetic arginine decarboxylase [Pseudomonadales bacterium]
MKANGNANWAPADAAELYGIRNWGAGYFDLADDGAVTVNVTSDGRRVSVSIPDIIAGMQQRGLQMPVLLRIENLLDSQLTLINETFARAISNLGYQGCYRGVFPIKVNQQCQVIEEIARFGASYGHGLEAGSKAELLIALASLDPDSSHIVCNGYKDEEFITLGLQSLKLGYRCTFVIETPTELPVILACSRRIGVRPILGLRVKLASRVGGYWNESSGDRSLFGLTTSQIVEVIDALREHEMLDCLQLLHYHLGSQIPNIRDIRSGVLEACRYYVDLVKEGATLGYLDLGGGLAVDYDGTQTNFEYSKNYSLDEYCTDIVETIMTTLDPEGIAHPVIVTESGRATVAYSSVLLFNILDVTRFESGSVPEHIDPAEHDLIRNLAEVFANVSVKNLQECYNDAVYYRDEIRELFKRGQIRLRSLSLSERLFLEIVRAIVRESQGAKRLPPGLEGLEDSLSDIYYGNFSVFQSLPDVWAIEQVFPLMPVHRHREKPTRQAIIADITCDSDGKIDRFINPRGLQKTLPVHPLREGEPYYFGVFLVGAYQETLGDLHNLMGDTHVVSVRINGDGSFDFVREMGGDSIADVLSYVEYQPQQLLEQFRRTAERAVRSGRIAPVERQNVLELFSASLRGYTYFED